MLSILGGIALASHFADMAPLPFRMAPQLQRALGNPAPVVSILAPDPLGLPGLKGVLDRPVDADISFVLKVHASNGIPLASASVDMARGDRSFETRELVFLGMEGYAHLAQADRQSIERRVWSRRACATASILPDARGSRVKAETAPC